MPNIKFSYRYRDSGNYKKHQSVTFDNPIRIDLSELEELIRSKSIFGEYFYATEWGLPEFFTEHIDFRIDPTWHEFESVEYTDVSANTSLDLSDFIMTIEKTKWIF